MTKPTTLQQLFELARDNAAKMFNETGEVLPMWHAVCGNGEHALIATPWGGDDDKDKTIVMLRALFAEKQVKRYAFICEAWVAKLQGADLLEEGPRPSEHPNRREVLCIAVEDRSGKQLSGHYFILRPEQGKPTLSPFHLDEFDAVSGRMTGLLS